jgi:RNA recognition motif-containing protein
VEFAERAVAEDAIKKFDGQLFMGRPLAVSEARAREDRGPGGPPRSGGYAAPRPGGYGGGGGGYGGGGGGYSGGGGGGFSGPRAPGGFSPSRAGHGGEGGHQRQRDFGPPAPPKDKKKPFKKEDKPRGPIPTKFSGRMYDLDGTEDEDPIDITPDFMKHDDPVVDAPDDDKDAADTDADKDKD